MMQDHKILSGVAESKPPINRIVAVVGCDGSGKTRLAHDLTRCLREDWPTERWYMGLVSGETGEKIKQLPVIGVAAESYLASKARAAQDMRVKLPGAFAAVVMYLFSQWRAFHLHRLTKRMLSGVLIIAERYPQAEIPGFHNDGPGLSVDRTNNWLARRLAIREQKLYERMAKQKPALVIRLTIDVDTAYARKPDHPVEELRDKIETMPLINYNGSNIVEIDACLPYDLILKTSLQAIRATVAASWKNEGHTARFNEPAG